MVRLRKPYISLPLLTPLFLLGIVHSSSPFTLIYTSCVDLTDTRIVWKTALDKDSVHEFDSNKLRVVSEAYKVDRRHGKRPLPSDEAEEKEDQDHIFPVYSARSQQDMSAMVSALTQVIGNTDKNPLHDLGNPSPISHHSATTPHDQPSQLLQDQGTRTLSAPLIHVI